ncbi:efflux RND transporter periplasmic adaptor subunit [Synechocystis sp. PCC 7339]|uniref:efflux RND transporter periplasmic adaptor subunit n=1 Tax=Synechocystis sp. PCC 7339 TaxID=2782213 RepID=UPI001CC01CCE|nr:efflux RND transporter periplasmic adaptor subunit [Synechocystis sp. PCC 7339]UAJ71795.1 efflux RND transporter periplasmic adaptor subunit [Synechocystis sp. PCC 7339]
MNKYFSHQCLRRQLSLLSLLSFSLMGCGNLWEQNVKAQTDNNESNQPIAVDVALAKPGDLGGELEYTGTTAPVREVSIKSQIEGRLQKLLVDVGDRVKGEEVLAEIEDDLLLGAVDQAKAEKMAQRSEVLTAQSQVGDAKIRVEQARLQLQQAQADITRLETSLNARIEQARLEVDQTQADAARFRLLAEEGAGGVQQAEQAETRARQAKEILRNEQASASQQLSQAKTAAKTASQILNSAIAQVEIEQQRVGAATAQMNAQRASIDQAQTRQEYATVRAPFPGRVLRRSSESGNLVQPGTEILQLGDFRQLEINVQVSELQLAQIALQQQVSVKLDAFPGESFTGVVTRISPQADVSSRLVPVEVTMDNPGEKIGAGLLARISFGASNATNVVVPESAIVDEDAIFVVTKEGEKDVLERRSVTLGEIANGKVEVVAGLAPQERFVVRSSRPLQPDSPIRLSVLSEK